MRHEPGVAPDGTTVDEPFVTLDWTFVLAEAHTDTAHGEDSDQ